MLAFKALARRHRGVSPVTYDVPRSQWVDRYEVLIERDGYHDARGELRHGAMMSRTVGIAATSGIMLLFKRPTTFKQDHYEFELVPLDRPAPPPALRPSAAAACTPDQIVEMKRAGLNDAQVGAVCSSVWSK